MAYKHAKKLVLHVPPTFDLPVFYETATPEIIAQALTLGANLYETLQTTATTQSMHEIEQQKKIEISRIKESSEKTIAELQQQLEHVEKTRTELMQEQTTRSIQMLEAQKHAIESARKESYTTAVNEHIAKLKKIESELGIAHERIAILQERRHQLEQSRDADILRAEERTRALLQHTIDEKQRAIERLEREKDKLNTILEHQTDELRTLGDLIRRKPQNVKTKGGEFETLFREKLNLAFGTGPNYKLECTALSNVGHAGDYIMYWGEHAILWEVKNYDKPVPTAEVDKFHRDVRENAHVKIGVMVSRYTPIIGKHASGDRSVEFLEGKMYIYLNNYESMSDDALPSLMLLFKLWWESSKEITESETLIHAIRTIEKLHSDAMKAKTEWRLHKSRNDDLIRWMAEQVEKTEERLQYALKTLQGNTHKQIEIPPNIFRDVTGEDRATEIIQSILEIATYKEDDSCVLNDLAEGLAKKKGFSRDTMRSHIRGVLLDTSIIPQHGKNPARVKGLVISAV